MTTAAKLERLVRILPGVAGYQDRERARETDKQLRMRLGDELKRLSMPTDSAIRCPPPLHGRTYLLYARLRISIVPSVVLRRASGFSPVRRNRPVHRPHTPE